MVLISEPLYTSAKEWETGLVEASRHSMSPMSKVFIPLTENRMLHGKRLLTLTFPIRYCAAFAEPAKIPTWQKAWIPEKYNGQTIRGNDAKLDAYIKEVSRNQFDPSKTLRFSKLTVQTTFNQMAVPFGVIDDICGYCLPQSEATAGGLGGTRVNYESGDFLAMVKQEVTAGACKRGTGSNGAGCTSSSTTSTSSTSSTKATPKAKATPKSKGTKSS